MVYSTCTLTAEENEDLIREFLSANSNWSVDEIPALAPWLSPLEPGGYRLWPHRDRCAGAYAIRLLKSGEGGQGVSRHNTPLEIASDSTLPDVLRDSGQLIQSHAFRKQRQWFAWPSEVPEWLTRIPANAPEIAYQPAKVFQPAHSLALRRDGTWISNDVVELSKFEAQNYLQGQTSAPREAGWSIVRWLGHPLGWIHSNHLRANNGLPSAARLPFPAQL